MAITLAEMSAARSAPQQIQSGELVTSNIKEARTGFYMHLFTGAKYYPLDPRACEIDIRDIARSLATKARYNGMTRFPYPVGQHSRYTALFSIPGKNSPRHRLARLLHDGTEPYNGDLIRPLKADPVFSEPFKKIEHLNEAQLAIRFDIPFPFEPHVKIADNAVTTAEVRQLVKQRTDIVFDTTLHDDSIMAEVTIVEESYQETERKFLDLFTLLQTLSFHNESDQFWTDYPAFQLPFVKKHG